MADNLSKKKNFIPKPPQKPNYQVWIILSLIVLVSSIFYFNQSSGVQDITERKFESILEKGYVKQVVIVKNQDYVEVTLNDEGLKNTNTKPPESPAFSFKEGPQYRIKVVSAENFIEEYKQMESKLPEDKRVGYQVESRSDFTSFILNWGFLILLLFFFWFIMRRMTGTAGPGGQIFNIGKSRAALFDAEAKVKVTFADVAGLDEAKVEVMEIVEFLKNPARFTKLGGKIPKGALLVGQSGHGKDPIGKGCCRRGSGSIFLLVGIRLRGNVCGCGRCQGSRPVQTSQREGSMHCLY